MKDLLKELIRAESTAETGELRAAEVLAGELERLGAEVRIDSWEGKRANLVGRLASGQARPALLFGCHLDVVPPRRRGWSKPAFEPVESEGRIFGRGAVDMKGPITAVIGAIEQLVASGARLKGDVIIAAVAGEEKDSCGAKRFISEYADKLGPLGGVIIPEPTGFTVVTAHRGLLWLKVKTIGKSAHSSMPDTGINAIWLMKRVLDELAGYRLEHKRHPLLGQCTISVNTIEAGRAINVVPDECSIGIDIRTLPGQSLKELVTGLEGILDRLKQSDPNFAGEVFVVREVPALETRANCDFVQQFCSCVGAGGVHAVGFTTDGPHFERLGAPVVIFGPGKPQLCHKPDEYIELSEIEKAAEYYRDIILHFLG